jgi:DSF synthase
MEQTPKNLDFLQRPLTHAVKRFDPEQGIAWCYMNAKPRPCITLELLEDVRKCQHLWEHMNRSAIEKGKEPPVRYAVVASLYPGVYNYGGDLELFIGYIENRDREGLRTYARMCIEDVYLMSVNLKLPMTTISLVQGDALGGGFEAALSCNLIIAEKGAQFGFPEILFNLFPGMGAYSLLSRKIGASRAEKIIVSGSLYSASEMHEMGVVDLLAEDGEGEQAVYDYVKRHARRRNAFQSILQVRHRIHPICREELMDVAEIWVDATMNIGSKELRTMERLVRAQENARENPNGIVAFQKLRP